ncbi:peroxiredoxin [Rhodovulum adriaticum]|uniref:Alkyl hydroperoxide reductase C n=1 Tax=Rhodovulum adriaticum TaxID=35804 RepID=A0A4R2NY28_RHOAD|nr:peroxiredoxin [Rhodovulum adriaticum]MBK1634278.1 peroxidase [Rhodovulum adriaticum]TCP27169.1 1-Cys peroxiredoxin [Rhodovulum adriaticum]
MTLRINDIAPNFTADTTEGQIDFHEWIGDSYAVLFSHPADFTPVCTTEFAAAAKLADEFAKRNTKVIGISMDTVEEHLKWKSDVEQYAGTKMAFPIIADDKFKVAQLYDMLPADAYSADGTADGQTATVRTTFIINPDKKIELMLIYPMTVGRNFDEILRALDAIQNNKANPVATPADWRPGDDMIVRMDISTEDAKAQFGEVEEIFPYLRKVKTTAA